MQTLTITIKPRNEVQRPGFWPTDERLDFWSSGETVPPDDTPERAKTRADALEARLINQFPRRLTELVQRSLALEFAETWTEQFNRNSRIRTRILRAEYRLASVVFRYHDISYGSLKIELDVPDPDAIFEILGNNAVVLEAILEEYAPEAFNQSTLLLADNYGFHVEASSELRQFARRRETRQSARIGAGDAADRDNKEDAKQTGARIAANLIRSPLVFPIILIMFLWYIARQDMLAERQIVAGLMQTLIQQETTTLTTMKDVVVKSADSRELLAGVSKATVEVKAADPKAGDLKK